MRTREKEQFTSFGATLTTVPIARVKVIDERCPAREQDKRTILLMQLEQPVYAGTPVIYFDVCLPPSCGACPLGAWEPGQRVEIHVVYSKDNLVCQPCQRKKRCALEQLPEARQHVHGGKKGVSR